MSLSEKYEESVRKDQAEKKKQELAEEKRQFLKAHGFKEGMYELHRIERSEDQTALIDQAIGKIGGDRWQKAKLSFEKKDVMKKKVSREWICWLKGDKEPHYIKYEWKRDKDSGDSDGAETVFCGEISPATIVLGGKLFSGRRRTARKKLRKLAEATTEKRTMPGGFLSGAQEYVLLEYYPRGWNPHGSGLCSFVLFKDGYLFQGEGRRSVNIDGRYIYAGEGSENRQPLDDWLIENVKRINGEPAVIREQ